MGIYFIGFILGTLLGGASHLLVVAVRKLISKHVELVVEDHRGALLALELDADSASTSIKQFDLNSGLFLNDNALVFFFLFLVSSLLLVRELPSLI